MWGVRIRPKKLQGVYSNDLHWVHILTHTHKSPLLCPLFTPLQIINVDMRRHWFWYPESVGCMNELQEIFSTNLLHWYWVHPNAHPRTHTSHHYYVHCLDYECTNEKKGTGLVLVPRKCGVYEWDQKSYMICTVLIYIEYTQNAHSHTHINHHYVHCLHYFRLCHYYECRHDIIFVT